MLEFLQQNWLLLLGFVVIAVVMFRGPVMLRISGIRSVDPAGAVKLMNHESARVLDVREDKEWQQGHIPGATHIPLGQLSNRMGELGGEKDAPLVVVCRSGNRSTNAALQLRKAGFDNVYNLNGGTMAWQQAGMPLEK
jgi:rhodanese-related sulfurtransferase